MKKANAVPAKGKADEDIIELSDEVVAEEEEDEYESLTIEELRKKIRGVKTEIKKMEKEIQLDEEKKRLEAQNEDEDFELETFEIPSHCIPIKADVQTFDFTKLAKDTQFDVIVMDPPWQLASAAPTRGVALGYPTLPDKIIKNLPVGQLQKDGFIFIWVINSRYAFALELMTSWGYKLVDDISWVKHTVNRRLAKGHGFYLQHAKETCLVGKKGSDPAGMRGGMCSDVIYSERRGQSQKPEQLYERIEQLVPNGKYLEIFARRNNLRDYWVSIGIEL